MRFYGYRHYKSDLGRWVNRDPIEERGGLNVYGCVGNSAISLYDRRGLDIGGGLDTVVDVLNKFESGGEKLWSWGPEDPYTTKMKNWQAMEDYGLLSDLRDILRDDCWNWKNNHMSDLEWEPTIQSELPTVPNAWLTGQGTLVDLSSATLGAQYGTTPFDAASAYDQYYQNLVGGVQQPIPDELWTAAVGSFRSYVTADGVNCVCRCAKLRVRIYNSMTDISFGNYSPLFFWWNQDTQYMWWTWTDEFSWDENNVISDGGWPCDGCE